MSATVHVLRILPVQITRQIEAEVAIAVEEVVEFAPVLELFERDFADHAAFIERERLTVSPAA